jgi:RNA polymerase-interacting CarD/CdnL/TRCF family regulator
MYSVGDKVIHFTRGAGVITKKKEMQFTDTPHCYLVIRLLGSDSMVMVPADRAEDRLRPARKRAALRRLLMSQLAGEPKELPQDYRKRQKYLEGKLKSGQAKEWIKVVRDLANRDDQKSLSRGDQKLFDRAMDLLSGELALIHGIPQEEAMPQLQSMVDRREALADSQAESGSWWWALGQRVMESYTKSSAGTN